MSFLRRSLRPRSFSSSTTRRLKFKKHRATEDASEKRLRAYVSLYHQSSSWVTPENLDAYIDRVFVPENLNISNTYGKSHLYLNRRKEDFENLLASRDGSPRYGAPDELHYINIKNPPAVNGSQQQLSVASVSEIHAALWGNDVSRKPGLGSVKDAINLAKETEES